MLSSDARGSSVKASTINPDQNEKRLVEVQGIISAVSSFKTPTKTEHQNLSGPCPIHSIARPSTSGHCTHSFKWGQLYLASGSPEMKTLVELGFRV